MIYPKSTTKNPSNQSLHLRPITRRQWDFLESVVHDLPDDVLMAVVERLMSQVQQQKGGAS